MSVMAMAAHTGCNTVYGSTRPTSASLSVDELALPGRRNRCWLMGESFIVDHARRSVIPERLADIVLMGEGTCLSEEQYYHLRTSLTR